jgi:hypothetical protein
VSDASGYAFADKPTSGISSSKQVRPFGWPVLSAIFTPEIIRAPFHLLKDSQALCFIQDSIAV